MMNSGRFLSFLASINNHVYRLLNDAALACVAGARRSLWSTLFVPRRGDESFGKLTKLLFCCHGLVVAVFD